MKFFKKKTGRPSEKEQLLVRYIEKVIKEKNIPEDTIPMATNLEELSAIRMSVDNYEFDGEISGINNDSAFQNTSTETQPTIEDMEVGSTNEVIEPEVIPEATEVVQTSEVDIQQAVSSSDDIEEVPIQEDYQKQKMDELLTDELNNHENGNPLLKILQDEQVEEYDPFAEPIIERSYNQSGKVEETHEVEAGPLAEEEDLFLQEASSTPVDDLSSSSSSKTTARKTAKTLINLYAKIKAAIFKHWAKFDIAKIERLEFAGKLDTSIEVEQGVTFMEHVIKTNQKIDEAFEMEDDVREDLIESLADVVEEKKMVMSPSNRFFLELFSDLAESTQTGYQISSQNNRILTHLKHQSKRHRNAA